MNLLILTYLLCSVVCSALSAPGSETTISSAVTGVTRAPGSGEGLTTAHGDDDELELDEDLSGGDSESFSLFELRPGKEEKRKRKGKGKGKKNRLRGKSTTSVNPEHTSITHGHTSNTHTHSSTSTSTSSTTTQDPCTTTHLSYCIHGYCKAVEDLGEPVCICMKGYDGERCEIRTLEIITSPSGGSSDSELVQTVLVIIAVVLSVISCAAILLMTCAHYRSHKNYLASFLGTGAEQEKLQKPLADVVV